MLDTTPEIQKIQHEIFQRKTISERFLLGVELISFGRKVMEGNIKQNNPGINDLDLKIEVFKRCYSNTFTDQEKQNIIEFFKNHHNNRQPNPHKVQ